MKIVAFAGSNSSHSINKQLVQAACKALAAHTIELLDLNDYEMPLYSIDKEKNNGIPNAAIAFLDKLKQADGLIVSLAEHNRSYSTAFKNVFDWCSRAEKVVFAHKKMLLMSTSPGGYGGGNVMAEASKFFPEFGAEIVAAFSLPKFHDNFDPTEGIKDAALCEAFQNAIHTFDKGITHS